MKRMMICWLLTVLMLPCTVLAEEPVYFADANLKAAVEARLGKPNPTPTAMLALTYLAADNRGIVNLTGLEYAHNLQTLYLPGNQISDLSPLSGLTNLRSLMLQCNLISDIGPLVGLHQEAPKAGKRGRDNAGGMSEVCCPSVCPIMVQRKRR